jgi:hypothetical protein
VAGPKSPHSSFHLRKLEEYLLESGQKKQFSRSRQTPMSESTPKANRYRWEATEIRRAAEIVRDERFREQLLSIADEYDAAATEIEAQLAGERHK